VIHGERMVDDTPHVRVSPADVELPNHVRFTQYVFRMRSCAVTVVLDDHPQDSECGGHFLLLGFEPC
jgi:hypothetical protein